MIYSQGTSYILLPCKGWAALVWLRRRWGYLKVLAQVGQVRCFSKAVLGSGSVGASSRRDVGREVGRGVRFSLVGERASSSG